MKDSLPSLKKIHANQLDFRYFEMGSGPLVLCLHGFPDTPYSFRHLLPELAQAGFRAVAPFMRGYTPTEVPWNHDYRAITLGNDAIALAEALGYQQFSIVGHDWGAGAAYAATNLAPNQVQSIVAAAVPHFPAFKPTLSQLKKSWYMVFFQMPWIAERTVRNDDFAFIKNLWRTWSPNWTPDPLSLDAILQVLANPESLRAALGYYRALKVFPSEKNKRTHKTLFKALEVPTLSIAGANDGCIGLNMFDAMAGFVNNEYQFFVVENAGHFMQLEQPQLFNQVVVDFLKMGQLSKKTA